MCCTKKSLVSAMCVLALFLGLSLGSVQAVTIPQSTEQLVGNSSDVVRGRVISVEPQWDEAHTFIFTVVTVEVEELVLGSIEKGGRISIYVPGGLVGDTGIMVEHAASFGAGEDVIVYLMQLEGYYGVTSWEMGKFTVDNGTVREKNLPVAEYINEIKAVKK